MSDSVVSGQMIGHADGLEKQNIQDTGRIGCLCLQRQRQDGRRCAGVYANVVSHSSG